jgi:DNA-binding MarR family transcriptional regulator
LEYYLKYSYISNSIRIQEVASNPIPGQPTTGDRVDRIIEEWGERRPDLDFSPLEVVARVLRAAHHLQTRLDGIAAAYGLSHTGDLDVLTDLDRAPPYERTPSELAEALLVTTGGMTVRLNRLQGAGLIERRPNPSDGRGVLVRLTTTGKALAEDALATLLQIQATDIRGLEPSARTDLAGLLRALLVGLGDTPAFQPAVAVTREYGQNARSPEIRRVNPAVSLGRGESGR